MKVRRWSVRLVTVVGSIALALGLAAATAVGSGAAFAAVTTPARGCCSILTQSAAAGWGINNAGQLGSGTGTSDPNWSAVSGLSSGVVQVSAGNSFALALTSDGSVWAWGYNGHGELGNGTATESTVPVQVSDLTGITAVSAGTNAGVALRSDGTVWTWGENLEGELGDGTTTVSRIPVQVTGLTGVTQIAAGNGFVLALRSDGTVWAWGYNASGQLGNGTTFDSDVPVQVQGLSRVTSIAAGGEDSMAVATKGYVNMLSAVYEWGANEDGQIDGTYRERPVPVQINGIGAQHVSGIAAGLDYSVVLGTDGSVWDWGVNEIGQLGDGSTADSVVPVEAQGTGSGITQISAGESHVLALRSDGTVEGWGANFSGELGNGTDDSEAPNPTPVQVVGLGSVTSVSAGYYFSLAVHHVAFIQLPGATIRTGPGLGWLLGRGELTPQPGSAAALEGVFCTSAASCWAVGYFERNGAWLNEALRWDGHRWSRITTPDPGGTASGDTSELFGVRCTSPRNCWAVGFYERNGISELDEAIHWNGKSWSLVATPTPAGTLSGDFNELLDVACTSPDSCWADGEYGSDSATGEAIENQALHWNGRTWSLVTIPDPGDNATDGISALSAIRCTTPRNCWAIGSYGSIAPGGALFNEALHWNGRKWSLAAVPEPETTSGAFNVLEGLSCTSATNCWAAGSDGYDGSSALTVNQVLHWNGHKWSETPVPEPDGTGDFASNVLVGVSCSAPDSCWAIGYVGNLDLVAPVLNEALHWNGSAWSTASVPAPAGHSDDDHSFLFGIRCTSRTNCWASGQAQPGGKVVRNALLHWNGTRWSA